MADENDKQASSGMEVKSSEQATSSKNLGAAIVEQTQKSFNEERTARVVKQVQKIIYLREHSQYWAETNRRAAEFYQKKLDALNAGDFVFIPSNGGIQFNDEALRAEVFVRVEKPPVEDDEQDGTVPADLNPFFRRVPHKVR